MKLILLSGGSGQRLWPLSNHSRSKQFLKVLRGSNGLESMVQRVYSQIAAAGLSDSAVIATSEDQVEILQNQLGEQIPLVVEPSRRDTYPAIALAAVYLFSKGDVDPNEIVIVLPVDPYVDIDYFHKIKELENLVEGNGFQLGLLGVEPTYASEKYGYIVPKEQVNHSGALIVDHFKEKPDTEEAKRLIEQNALWNCGVFAFRLGFIIDMLTIKELPVQYELLVEQYEHLPKTSFDYEVVEKTKEIAVLPYQGEWKDLGTWNTLTEEMNTSILGNGIVSDDSLNTHVLNEMDLPVAVLGLSNAIVAVSPDGVLVSDKQSSSRIKEFSQHFYKRPMYEEKRWGWLRVLEHTKLPSGGEVVIKRVCLHEGKNLSYHVHHYRDETWTIMDGEGEFAMNGEFRVIGPGNTLHIPRGAWHAIRATSQLELIEVQMGAISLQDIHRQTMNWDGIDSL
jgi:mannose-1-phosphate guanylyltransferase